MVTRNRLLMSKNYYLNASNTKFLKVGIKPSSKMFKECSGFAVEVALDGKNMSPMSLGGLDGFLNLCQSLRSFDELKFAYPTSAAKYDEIESPFPLNINKKQIGGTMCFCIETMNGDTATIAHITCTELLKFENLIVSGIKKISALVSDAEGKFNDLVNKASLDFGKMLIDTEKSGDLLLIEIITNFNDLLKICIDEKKKFIDTNVEKPAKRRRAMAKKGSKKMKESEHIYAVTVGETEEDIEIIEEVDEAAVDKPLASTNGNEVGNGAEKQKDPLGLVESGQRFDSEVYV